MNKHMYLVGILGDCDLEYATTEEQAKKLAEEQFDEGDIGIWKLQRIGRKTEFVWETPEQEALKPTTNKHRQPWTREEDLALSRYVTEGYSDAQIAKKLGRTIRAVQLRQYHP